MRAHARQQPHGVPPVGAAAYQVQEHVIKLLSFELIRPPLAIGEVASGEEAASDGLGDGLDDQVVRILQPRAVLQLLDQPLVSLLECERADALLVWPVRVVE
jgi:hypothetical protein